jgi:hypothetical protein
MRIGELTSKEADLANFVRRNITDYAAELMIPPQHLYIATHPFTRWVVQHVMEDMSIKKSRLVVRDEGDAGRDGIPFLWLSPTRDGEGWGCLLSGEPPRSEMAVRAARSSLANKTEG